MKDKKLEILSIILVIAGVMARLIFIDKYLPGLNPDEATATYEAYSIGKCLMDRCGKVLPAMLIDFGSGKSPLYTYILIPIVKVFGVNIFTTRVPMALFNILSLFVIYKILKLVNDNIKKDGINGFDNYILPIIAFLSIMPCLIMKSRFGLEVNLFPEVVLYSFFFFLSYLYNEKFIYEIISSIILALSVYSYSVAFVFCPICLLFVIFYLFKIKRIQTFSRLLICLLIIFIVDLPLTLYVIINFFDLPEIALPFMTIPKLVGNRMQQMSLASNDNIVLGITNNLLAFIKLLFLQNDGLRWNTLKVSGIYYHISGVFLIVGIVSVIFRKKINCKINISFLNSQQYLLFENLIIIISIAAIISMLFVKDINANRLNICYYLIIFFVIRGLLILFAYIKFKNICFIALIIYMILFCRFINEYRNITLHDISIFRCGIDNVVKYTLNYKDYDIYFDDIINEPAVKVLYYLAKNSDYDPRSFINTVKYKKGKPDFESTMSFDNWHFVDLMTTPYIFNTRSKKLIITALHKDEYYKQFGLQGVQIDDYIIYK